MRIMIIDGVKAVPAGPCEPTSGHFALEKEPLAWEKCREQFANVFLDTLPAFYFACMAGECESVAQFVGKVERVIGCEESQFALTTRPNIVWVAPSAFWKSCHVRRSLFTVLLRSGRKYKPNPLGSLGVKTDLDNFEEALYSESYANDTKNAVMRFLFGFTKFDETVAQRILGYKPTKGTGWWTLFSKVNVEQIRQILVSPVDRPHSLIGAGEIWN